METKFSTSFIPKKPVMPTISQGIPRISRTPNIFLILSFVVLVCVAAALGIYFYYEQYLISKISALDTELKDAGSSIDRSVIGELSHANKEIRTAETLIGRHLAPSVFFKILQGATIDGVRFTSLIITLEGDAVIKMSGEARSYAVLAAQSNALLKNKNIVNPVISEMKLDDKKGTISFQLSTGVSQGALNYSNIASPVVTPAPKASGTSTATSTKSTGASTATSTATSTKSTGTSTTPRR